MCMLHFHLFPFLLSFPKSLLFLFFLDSSVYWDLVRHQQGARDISILFPCKRMTQKTLQKVPDVIPGSASLMPLSVCQQWKHHSGGPLSHFTVNGTCMTALWQLRQLQCETNASFLRWDLAFGRNFIIMVQALASTIMNRNFYTSFHGKEK